MTERLLISTDLDRTLIPNGPQPESSPARQLFAHLAGRAEVSLVYISGRDHKLINKAIRNFCLPVPDYVIGDVGSSMYEISTDGHWDPVKKWQEEIAADWQGHLPETLIQSLSGLQPLRLQEPAKQNRFKISYYVPIQTDFDELKKAIHERLAEYDLRCNLVCSVDEPSAIGLLDILPQHAGKLNALRALMQRLGFDNTNTVFCGDSGNDMEVLTSDIDAVLVANAMPEVRAAASERVHQNGLEKQLYVARGDFMQMNGNYSAGMLEGIAHYHPPVIRWLQDENTEMLR